MSLISLSYLDLATAALLVLINAGLSLWLQLGLARQLTIATVRMVVQLALVGLVLKALFALASPVWIAVAALAMFGFAGYEVMARQERRLIGPWAYGLGAGSMLLAAGLITVLALTAHIGADPWYDPRYAIPLLGMILGNTMTGVSLGLNTLTAVAGRARAAIEARMALGADRWTAFHTVTRSALRSGMIPIINAMATTGLVWLPGMMTGQILAGIDPTEAVKYQLLVTFLIAGATGLGVIGAVFGGVWRLSDGRHRLRLDRLVAVTSGDG